MSIISYDIFEELHGLFVADAAHLEYANVGTSYGPPVHPHFRIGGQCSNMCQVAGDDRDMALPAYFTFLWLAPAYKTATSGCVILFGR